MYIQEPVFQLSNPVTSIPNLGPAAELAFAKAGITTADEIRTLGPDESYRRLLLSGSRPHFIGYYVLVMGLQGRPWNDCKGDEKKVLRRRFDDLVRSLHGTEAKARSELEAALQFFGVVERH